jgi:cellulose synthase/poly-beta-1,6-N-acetylglucosamine synthase-like glycosyltransferase
LDEDAEITPQTITSMLTYIKNGGKPVADGPTVFPYDNNLLTFFVEAQRCWTYLWVKEQLETNSVLWMNGSNMLIRSDVEHAIGWNFKDCKFSEDTRFSYEAARKFGKVFGWHGGLTIEKPPKTAGAAIRQRKRWYWGGMLQLKQMSVVRLPRRIYSSICWFLGLILTACIPIGVLKIFFPHILFSTGISFLTIGGISVAGLFWLLRYQLGLYWQLKLTPASWLKKAGFHLVLLPLSPVIEFICTIPTLLAFINPPKVFQVTEKSGAFETVKVEESKELVGVGK